MSDLDIPGGLQSGRPPRAEEHNTDVSDPVGLSQPAGTGGAELEAAAQHRSVPREARPEQHGKLYTDLDVCDDDRLVDWEPGYGEESELEPDYDEEPELEPDYDEEPEFEPDDDEEPEFGPGEDPEHGPGPRLAPGPKHDHPPTPPHGHGHGQKKTAGKKSPGKKAGPKKHPGHPPPPPHEHDPGGPMRPEPGFGLRSDTSWGFGPGPGFGFGFNPGTRGHRRGSGPGRRSRRGDVRAALLTLLAEGPMHGYEMIQEIAERSRGLWRPSPGSVYPTLQMLDDEGLIVGAESEGGKRLFELTDRGRTAAEKIKNPPWQEIAQGVDPGEVDLRDALGQLFGAATQSAYAATAEQQQRIVALINKARREIYSILAESG